MGVSFGESKKHEMSMTEEAKSAVHVERKAASSGYGFLTTVYIVIALSVATYITLAATNVWGLYDIEWYWDLLIWATLIIAVQQGLEKIYPAYAKNEKHRASEELKIQKEAKKYEKTWKCRACGHQWIRP